MADDLQEVWDCLAGNDNLGGFVTIKKGQAKEENRPVGVCWPCEKFADEAFIHEAPATAECCRGCDAYKGF